jgi:hypothetical protein
MSQLIANAFNSALKLSPGSAPVEEAGKIDLPKSFMCMAFGGQHCKQQQNFGSSMQINNPEMYRTSAPCSQNPLQPECFSGQLAGTKGCAPGSGTCLSSYSAALQHPKTPLHTASARATENMNGSVPFSTLRSEDLVTDPEFAVESLGAEGVCIDCSKVDQATFMKQCVRDSNIGAATLKLAPCSVKANRSVSQDQGSRQPERISTRENTIFNLTDAKYSSPLVPSQANSTMKIHTSSSRMFGNGAELGGPANYMPCNASLVGRL